AAGPPLLRSRPQVLHERRAGEQMSSFGLGKQIQARHEEAVDERPEQLQPVRRQRVGAQPIEEQVRRVGAGAEQRDAPATLLAALSAEARSETAGLPTVARSAKA